MSCTNVLFAMSNVAKYMLLFLLFASCVGILIVNKQEQREQRNLVKSLENTALVKNSSLEQVFALLDSLIMNQEKMAEFELQLSLFGSDSISRATLMAVSEIFSESDSISRVNDNMILDLKNNVQLLTSTEYNTSSLQNLLARFEAEQIMQMSRVKSIRDKLLSSPIKGVEMYDVMAMLEMEENPFSRSFDINKGYYIMGTRMELVREKVIKNKYLIFGRMEVDNTAQLNKFSTIDIHSSRRLYIGKHHVELVSSHPADSYRYTKNGNIVKELIIDDPERFWSESKVLVITYRN
ncbi:MAG: hypothetical protein IKM58_06160 [Tidjanibacter sp.]|nr:hypothetical protein [Tidjanibacter sp.]